MSVCLVSLSLSFLFVLSIDAKATARFTCLDFLLQLELGSACSKLCSGTAIDILFNAVATGFARVGRLGVVMHVTEIIATKQTCDFRSFDGSNIIKSA